MINIEKYPQYELYQLTLFLYDNIELLSRYCSLWSIYNTIISRAYYCSYHLALLWLEDNPDKNFVLKIKPKPKKGKPFYTEHQQVRNAFKDCKKYEISDALTEFHNSRKLVDYSIFDEIPESDLHDVIKYMICIFDSLVDDLKSF